MDSAEAVRELIGGDEERRMRYDDLPQSDNIESPRRFTGGGGGGGFGFPMGGRGGLGIGTIVVLASSAMPGDRPAR